MKTTALTHAGRAVDAHTKAKLARVEADRRAAYATSGRQIAGRGYDAAASSAFTFLQGQLELIDADLITPLQAVTHPRDMPMEFGGGFPSYISEWASNYASTGGGPYGLQGTQNTEIPEAQVNIDKQIWPVYTWASAFTITWLDLQKLIVAQRAGQPAPFSLQKLYEESVSTVWAKALDYVTYLGFLGGSGLCNNPNAPAFVVPDGGSGTTWLKKNTTQILNDINQAINVAIVNSGYDFARGCPNVLLIPLTQFSLLSQPMTIGGVSSAESAISYITRNCVATQYGIDFKILPLPNPWISGQGLGGTDRGVLYKKDRDSLYLKVPTPAQKVMTIPTTKDGVAYQTVYFGSMSSVIFRRTQTMTFLDAI